MERKTEDDVVMRMWKMEVGGERKIGRPKLRWSDVIRKGIKEKGVKIEEETQYRTTWRLKSPRNVAQGIKLPTMLFSI